MARTKTPPPPFRWVVPTADEVQGYRDTHHGRLPHHTVRRMACRVCEKRIWGSGLAIGAHRRSCPGHRPADPAAAEITELIAKIVDAQMAADTAVDQARRAQAHLEDLQDLLKRHILDR